MSVNAIFERLRSQNRAALVGYLPAAFPDFDTSVRAVEAMIESGCDIIEIGLPYSDPVMDGPVIQDAAAAALAGDFHTADVLRLVESVSGAGAPIVVMTYWNPIEKYGVAPFARDLAAAGGSGLITPDLIPEEAEPWIDASEAHDLDRIFLVAPSSTPERIASTVSATRGFVYAQSVMGVTGAREATSQAAPDLVARTREFTKLPIGVGLGVRSGAQAAEVAAYADAVIVGSAMVSCLSDAPDSDAGLKSLRALTAELAAGVNR